MPTGSDIDRMKHDLATAKGRLLDASASALERALRESVLSGFYLRRDVDGAGYKPAKDGHLPQMDRTGTLKRSYEYGRAENAQGVAVKVSEDTPYGKFLRDGTSKMDPRRHIPRPEEAAPARWDRRIRAGLAGAARQAEARR